MLQIRGDIVKIFENESLKLHSTFRIGGKAKYFTMPETIDEIKESISFAKENGLEYMIIGNGSNILFGDEGYDGLIICLTKLKGMELINKTSLRVNAGELMSSVGAFAYNNGLGGMEALAGIPGTIGGGIYMNCGAYGSEIKDVLRKVCYLYSNGEMKIFDVSELDLSYRHSIFANEDGQFDGAIVYAELELFEKDKNAIEEKMAEHRNARKSKQPLEYPSCGSTFKRPVGYFAAQLIDECGLKGKAVGDACVSEKHAGFVINKGEATCAQVLELVDIVKETVLCEKGVMLECEIKVVGK
ncbi:MAG: UDP-N-acetylmuramate dehydrogenase [Clostridia bacterium]|nr:UDP-N-acetylmuramate dehydrogenase [Clostridia bacterium]